MFSACVKRELLLSARSRQEWINTLIFFVMVTSLLPLAVGSEPKLLVRLAGGVIWITALLATLLSLDPLFRNDYEDGSFDQMILLPGGLFEPVAAKILVHWFVTGLPLTLISPLLGMMFGLNADAIAMLFLSLAAGTPYFSCVGSIGAGLTVSLRKSGLIVSLIVMPLYIPVLILGASAVGQVVEGYNANGLLLVVGALSAFSIALSPLAIIAALRATVDA